MEQQQAEALAPQHSNINPTCTLSEAPQRRGRYAGEVFTGDFSKVLLPEANRARMLMHGPAECNEGLHDGHLHFCEVNKRASLPPLKNEDVLTRRKTMLFVRISN